MIRLLKFEFQKKWKMSLGVLLGYFLIYFVFLFKFKAEGTFNIERMPFQLVFFILLASGLFFAAGISAINSLRVEAKNSSRDLYFALPLTAYTKIGSKLIVSTVEATLAAVIGTISCIKALEYLTGFGVMKFLFQGLQDAPLDEVILALYVQILAGVLMLLIIYLSFAIFRSFFSQVRLGGLITIIIYIILMYLNVRYVFPFISIDTMTTQSIGLAVAGMTAYTVIIFGLVGYLFEKRASFD